MIDKKITAIIGKAIKLTTAREKSNKKYKYSLHQTFTETDQVYLKDKHSSRYPVSGIMNQSMNKRRTLLLTLAIVSTKMVWSQSMEIRELIKRVTNFKPPVEICNHLGSLSITLTHQDPLFSYFNTDQFTITDENEDPNKWSPIVFTITDSIDILGKIQYNDSIVALFLSGNSIACFCINVKTCKVIHKKVVCFRLGNIHGSTSVTSVLLNNNTLRITEEQNITNFTWDENTEQVEPVHSKNEYEWHMDTPESD